MRPRRVSVGMRAWSGLVGAALLLGGPAAAPAEDPQLDGSVSIVWYANGDASDGGPAASDADSRLLERFRLNVRDLGPGLDFHTSFATRQWFGGERDGDSEARIHQAYLRGRGSGGFSGLTLQVGRHWRYGTGATGLLDGATVAYRRGRVRLETFAGTRDWEDRDEVRWPSFDRSRWVGLSWGMRLTSWAEVDFGYNVLRRGDVDDREIIAGAFDVRPLRAFRVTGEIRFDDLRDHALDRRVRVSWRPDARRELWAEAAERRPDLDPTWFLANFRDLVESDREEYRFGGRWGIAGEVGVQADVLAVDHGKPSPASSGVGAGWELREPDDWSWDTRTRLTWRGQSIGWYGGGGYGGERSGLLLSASRRVHTKVRVGLDANAVSYEYGRGPDAVDEDLATLAAWAEARLDRETWVSAQIERLDNAVDDSDVRFLVRVRRGFRWGG